MSFLSSTSTTTTDNVVSEEFQFLETVSERPPSNFMEKVLKYPKATSYYNFPKNRFPNILPNENTRVKLSAMDGVVDSDYINANFVKSAGSSYICCQAPLPSTFADFWKMIWEQECSVIVMLTELVTSDGQNKAHCYWPTEPSQPLKLGGSLVVTLVEQREQGNFITRFFNLTNSMECRRLAQIQYVGWPDFSVPATTSEFVELLSMTDKLKDCSLKENGEKKPILVHCSAGIGRTGVFVAARACLKLAKQAQPINVLQIVKSLRDQRAGMVTTLEQYEFIYSLVNCYVAKKKPLPLTCCNQFGHDSPFMAVEPYKLSV
eukprot:TRINITY_DN8131_c0_g1_i1.p1 TRINITY_DN8131_c0_g1~~TRINITY_DN8131_c0_g1_i1.p1  ORF type:complete len:319 (-),score=53.37 TRINITY_DN8131_c0_g1_i1:208-1164(-)